MLLCGGLIGAFFLLWLFPFGLWGTKSMIPLYWLGVFGFPALFDGRLSKRTSTLIGLLCFVSFCVFVLCEGNVMVNGLGFYWCKMGLLEFSWKGFFLMMARYVTGALGAIGVLTVIMALCRYRWIATSSVYGRETLGIYLIHFVFLFPFLKLVNVTNGFVRLGLVCVFFLFCHYAVVLSKRFSMVKTLLWGPEEFKA